jgi:hypothetical protein
VRGVVLLVGAALALGASSGKRPTYRIEFVGSGTQHRVDVQSYVLDDGSCNARQSIDQTANFLWTSSWSGFTMRAPGEPAGEPGVAGSTIQGTDVKDACGQPPETAPPDWIASSSCNEDLTTAASVDVRVASRTRRALVVAVTAPVFAVPVTSNCSLTIRMDQLVAHISVPIAKLTTLARKKSLVFPVGTAHPGSGDYYAPSLDCSHAAKPYEGFRVVDSCRDEITWSGTVTVTRA